MASDSESRNVEHTYLLDPENTAEMARLEIQARFLTKGMGGVLPEFHNALPTDISSCLDLGCGPGEWAREVAHLHPAVQVVGFDISEGAITYAQSLAKKQHLRNIHFDLGNLLDPLPYPDASFDMINGRMLVCVLKNDRWPLVLRECLRVVKPGGWIRLTECDDFGQTNSPACELVNRWYVDVCRKVGYAFPVLPYSINITPMLGRLLTEAGWGEISYQDYALDISYGSEIHPSMCQDYRVACKQAERLMLRLAVAEPEEFQRTFDALVSEVSARSFHGIWRFLTVRARRGA